MVRDVGTEIHTPGGSGPNLPKYDERAWPIVVVTMPGNVLPHDAWVTHLNYLDAMFERGQPFVLIFDSRHFPDPGPVDRKLIARHMSKMEALYPGRLRGLAMVMSSALSRGAFLALKWLVRPPYPTVILSTMSEAMDWVKHYAGFDSNSMA